MIPNLANDDTFSRGRRMAWSPKRHWPSRKGSSTGSRISARRHANLKHLNTTVSFGDWYALFKKELLQLHSIITHSATKLRLCNPSS